MAQRSLGAHWQRRTPEEQTEFIKVFSDLLEQTYVDKIESYNNEKFIYMNERIDGRYAEVGSKMRTAKGEEFTINYKLHRVGEDWRVYDLVIENVSLMNNYRSQFNRILTSSTYDELVIEDKSGNFPTKETRWNDPNASLSGWCKTLLAANSRPRRPAQTGN